MSEKQDFQITPIGAAYVEALPDRKRAKAIQRQFDEDSICPASMIFTEQEVVEFYKKQGKRVAATSRGVKGKR